MACVIKTQAIIFGFSEGVQEHVDEAHGREVGNPDERADDAAHQEYVEDVGFDLFAVGEGDFVDEAFHGCKLFFHV